MYHEKYLSNLSTRQPLHRRVTFNATISIFGVVKHLVI